MIIVWRVTQQCNLTCPFCAFDRRLPRERVSVNPEKVWRFGKVLADYQDSTGDRILLSWLGGEPLLWPPLFALSHKLSGIGIAQSATTNGTGLSSSKVQDLVLDCFSELTVSVDALAEVHDGLRGAPGGWRRMRAAVTELAARRGTLKMRANVVLMRDTLQIFPTLCEELTGWGIDEITFNTLGGRDRPEFFALQRLEPRHVFALEALLPSLRARLEAKGVRLCGGMEYIGRIAASALGECLPVHDCRPGERFLFIDEAGRLAPCSFTTDRYSVTVDSIMHKQDLLTLPNTFATMQMREVHTACADCPSTQVFEKFAA